MQIYQLDFFKNEEESEIEALRAEIKAVKTSSDKVRKGTYARIGELTKLTNDLQDRLRILERNVCQKNLIV